MSQKLLSTEESERIYNYCFDRYGVDFKHWLPYDLYQSNLGVWTIPKSSRPLILNYEFENFGLRVLSGQHFPFKITFGFVQLFSTHMKKGIIEVSKSSAEKLLMREDCKILDGHTSNGYLVIKVKESSLLIGICLKRGEILESQIPKSIKSQLSAKRNYFH